MSQQYQYQQQQPLHQQQQQLQQPYHQLQDDQQQHIYPDDEDEMDQVVTSNVVDYNTNDSKYMYDDFTENEEDYIATGDIVTTSTVTPIIMNTQTHYTSSYGADIVDPNLNDPYSSGNNQQIGNQLPGQLADIDPITQTTLTNHKANLYCDNGAYDLIDPQLHDDGHVVVGSDGVDEINKMGNNNYLGDQMYDGRYVDSSGNIIFDQNQPVSNVNFLFPAFLFKTKSIFFSFAP